MTPQASLEASFVFLSHSHQDRSLADRVAHDLRFEGYDVFMTPDGLAAGEEWRQTVYGKLEQCSAVIALVTERSLASDECKVEWYAMEPRQRPLVLCMDHALQADRVPSPLRHRQAQSGFERIDRALRANGVMPTAVPHRLRLVRSELSSEVVLYDVLRDDVERSHYVVDFEVDDPRVLGGDMWESLGVPSDAYHVDLVLPCSLLSAPWPWLLGDGCWKQEERVIRLTLREIVAGAAGAPRGEITPRVFPPDWVAGMEPIDLSPESSSASFAASLPAPTLERELWAVGLRESRNSLDNFANAAERKRPWLCIVRGDRLELDREEVQRLAVRCDWFVHAPIGLPMEEVVGLCDEILEGVAPRLACARVVRAHPGDPLRWPSCFGAGSPR